MAKAGGIGAGAEKGAKLLQVSLVKDILERAVVYVIPENDE